MNTPPRYFKVDSLGAAHETVIKYILEKGDIIKTEDNEMTAETGQIIIHVENPLNEPMYSNRSKFKKLFLEKYASDFIQGTKSEFDYDYYSRLHKWGCGTDTKGNIIEVDQIKYILEKLKKSKYSRRAIAITWNPPIDHKKKDVPCLQIVQFTIRSCKLSMTAVFRSNDMLSALGANMYALVSFQKYISELLGCMMGSYTHISIVPHVYYLRDSHDIKPFCEENLLIHPKKEVCEVCNRCNKWK